MEQLDNFIYFSADDGAHGHELWRTDGTEAGTILLKEINPGPTGSHPSQLTLLSTKLAFTANDAEHGREPWITDGTTGGTMLIKDLNPGPGDALSRSFTGKADHFYFKDYDGIWKSNGTPSGTIFIHNITPYALQFYNNRLYFTNWNDSIFSTDGTNLEFKFRRRQLQLDDYGRNISHGGFWIVDGELFFGYCFLDENSIREEHPSYKGRTDINILKLNRDTQFFESFFHRAYDEEVNLMELYAGINRLFTWKDNYYIHYYTPGGSYLSPLVFDPYFHIYYPEEIVVNNDLFFSTTFKYKNQYDPELWKWNGAVKTNLVNKFIPKSSSINNMTIFKNKVFFEHTHPVSVRSGSVTDGLSATVVTEDTVAWATILNDEIYYSKYGTNYDDHQLWKSDGTPGGNTFIKKFYWIDYLIATQDRVFILAYTPENKHELWQIPTTSSIPTLVKIFGDFVSSPITPANNLLWFRLGQDESVWRSDGTTEGTFALNGIKSTEQGDFIAHFKGQNYLITTNISGHNELSKSDGSINGTLVALDASSLGIDNVDKLYTSTNYLYLQTTLSSGNPRLISFNGNESEPLSSEANEVVAGDVFALFTSYDGRLWSTFGTLSSTQEIATNALYVPLQHTLLGIWGDKGYFMGYDEEHGYELWETDGTADGTRLFLDIEPGKKSSFPGQLFVTDGILYFMATTSADGRELYSYFTESPTGTESEGYSLSLFPNPSSGDISISTISPIEDIIALDIAGNSIPVGFKVQGSNAQVQLQVTNGLYIIKVKTKAGSIQKKVIISK
jgi:ELWxxDGT repeat protein